MAYPFEIAVRGQQFRGTGGPRKGFCVSSIKGWKKGTARRARLAGVRAQACLPGLAESSREKQAKKSATGRNQLRYALRTGAYAPFLVLFLCAGRFLFQESLDAAHDFQLGIVRTAPAFDLDPLAFFQVLVMLKEMLDLVQA